MSFDRRRRNGTSINIAWLALNNMPLVIASHPQRCFWLDPLVVVRRLRLRNGTAVRDTARLHVMKLKKPLLDGRCPLKCSWFSKILRLLAVFNVAFPNALPVLFPASISLQAPVDSQTPRRSEDSQSPSHSQTIPEHIQLTAFHLLPANGNFGNRYTR